MSRLAQSNIEQFPINRESEQHNQAHEINVPQILKSLGDMQADICREGMGKTNDAKDWNNKTLYKFRGIDDVYNLLSGLFHKHNVRIKPVCREKIEKEFIVKEKIMFYVSVTVDYVFTSTLDGSEYTATMFAQATDYGDKAMSKAMSMAFKYTCLQVFCIPTEGDNDPDATVHEPIYQNQRSQLQTYNHGQQQQRQAQSQQLGKQQQRQGAAQQQSQAQNQQRLLNDGEKNHLLNLLKILGREVHKFLAHYQLNSMDEVTLVHYKSIVPHLTHKIEQQLQYEGQYHD